MAGTIIWVFGGTAVGKKHFIRSVVENPSLVGFTRVHPFWMEDGVKRAREVFEHLQSLPKEDAMIVRWQWQRERQLNEIIVDFVPKVQHIIILIKTSISNQVGRVINREGKLKWSERGLIRECEDVDFLVQSISDKHRIPVLYKLT